MNRNSGRLSLGALPKTETMKVTITLSADLKTLLDRYAALHSQTHGEAVDAVGMIPHMLAAFVERDRGFKALSRGAASRARPKTRLPGDPGSEASAGTAP